MKYLKLYEQWNSYVPQTEDYFNRLEDFNEEDYNQIALDYANKYYKDEVDSKGPYGNYFDILDRLNDFCNEDFPNGLNNIPYNIELYRFLNVESESDINKESIGKHFVADKDLFEDYDFVESFLYRYISRDELKKCFIVTIETTSDNLDIDQILGNRAEYPSEFEFTLKNDKNIKIIDISETEAL